MNSREMSQSNHYPKIGTKYMKVIAWSKEIVIKIRIMLKTKYIRTRKEDRRMYQCTTKTV